MMNEEKQAGYLLDYVITFIKENQVTKDSTIAYWNYDTDIFLKQCCEIVGYYEGEYIDE